MDTRFERARQPPITTVSQKAHLHPGDPTVQREKRRDEFREQLMRDGGYYIVRDTLVNLFGWWQVCMRDFRCFAEPSC